MTVESFSLEMVLAYVIIVCRKTAFDTKETRYI